MATRLVNLNNPQELTVVVSGPEDANRLIICTGEAPTTISSYGNYTNSSFTFLVGPVLTRRQFVRAVASAGITRQALTTEPSVPSFLVSWLVLSTDADWDDESGQVEVRVELRVETTAGNASISGISYNVSILAALPAT